MFSPLNDAYKLPFKDQLDKLQQQQEDALRRAAEEELSGLPGGQKGSKGKKGKGKGLRSTGKGKGRKMNPRGRDGKIMTCRTCNAIDHFQKDCPKGGKKKVHPSRTQAVLQVSAVS